MLAGIFAAAAIAAASPYTGRIVNTGGADMEAAFKAVFGSAKTITRAVIEPEYPPGSNSHVWRHPVQMSLKAGALVDLGGSKYALVVVERNVRAAHVEPGAIAIAYLSSLDTGWRVDHVYPEFIWSGNFGEPADDIVLVTSFKAPILDVSKEYVGQGQHSTVGWLIQLSSAKPTFLGSLPAAGMLERDACISCLTYDYGSNLDAPHDPSAYVSVHYIGWKETAPGEQTPIDKVVDYVPSDNGLKGTHDPDLPG